MAKEILNAPGTASQVPQMGEKPSLGNSLKKTLQKLSLREKIMIWALILIALVMALVFLLILPEQDRLVEAEMTHDTLIAEENRTLYTIASMPSNKETLDAAQERYNESLLLYQAVMLPEDVDRMITTLVEESGFTSVSLTLNPYTNESIATYYPTATSWEVPQSAYTESSETAPVEEGATGEAAAATDDGMQEETQASTDGTAESEEYTSGLDEAVLSDETTLLGSAEAQTITVFVTMRGYEESFYTFINRIMPLSWMKIESSTFTPPPTIYADYAALEQSYSFTLKLYVHPNASIKTP